MKSKTIASLFEDIDIKDKGKQKTIKTQVLDFFDQNTGSREKTKELQQPELRKLVSQYLESTDGIEHFPRDDAGDWPHSRNKAKVLHNLAQIATQRLTGMIKRAQSRSMPSASDSVRAGKAPAREYQVERTGSTKEEYARGADLAVYEEQEFPEFDEHLPEIIERPQGDIYDIASTPTRNSVEVRDQPVASAREIYRYSAPAAYGGPLVAGQEAGPSVRKRQHPDTIHLEQEREEETEDDSENEELEDIPAVPVAKNPRLDTGLFVQQQPLPKTSIERAAQYQPTRSSHSPELHRYERIFSPSTAIAPALPQVIKAAPEGFIGQPTAPCEKCARLHNVTLHLLEEIKYAVLGIESSHDGQIRNFEEISQIFQNVRDRYERIAARD